jgi:hypothetical protein
MAADAFERLEQGRLPTTAPAERIEAILIGSNKLIGVSSTFQRF